jgi:ribose transport system permease protein
MQMPAAAREMIFGAIILVMLLVHGLTDKNEDI